jgi:FkbM family methyltransferase
MAYLLARRRTPCLVTPDTGGGWRHRYRQGVIVSPTPVGPSWKNADRATVDVFLYKYSPQEGDVVFDIGAGWGTEAPTLSRLVGPTGRVVAVEAHPWTCDLLRRTVAANRLENVTVVQAAVSDQPGELNISDLESISNTVMDGTAGHVVEAVTLDDLAKRCGVDRIDLLKMNIEGAERLAVCGMSEIAPRVRHVVISCHDFRADRGDGDVFRTRVEVAEALTAMGFDLSTRPNHPLPWVRDYLYGIR